MSASSEIDKIIAFENLELTKSSALMADFPLFVGLPPILQEQIIAKLHWKSYFRLQQTCRQIKELVRISQKLYTRIDKNSNFKWLPEDNGEFRLALQFLTGVADISDIYGIKLKLLGSPRDMMDDFSEFCEAVTKHRITCSVLSLRPHSAGFELSKEQCAELIRILKPEEIIVHYRTSDVFKVVVRTQNLKRLVVFGMDPDIVCSFMGELMEHRDVELRISTTNTIPEQIALVLRSVCQLLRSAKQLQEFELSMDWGPFSNFGQQLLQELYQMSIFRKYQPVGGGMRFFIEMPNGSFCKLVVCQTFMSIVYQQNSSITE